MKVCLISAPTANQLDERAVGEAEAARIMGELAPIGILSLAAVLESRGLQPEVVDLNRVYYEWLQNSKGNGKSDFCRFAGDYLARGNYDLLGFSTVCSSYPLTIRIAREVKQHRPESVVVLGGPQASVVDQATMRAYPFIDLVVRGEAEETLPELVDALAGPGSLDTIPGITFRRDGDPVRTPDAPLVTDLDSLPFPAFHLFPDVRYCRHFPLELGRGCPFACTFCSTNDFFRRRFRLKSPAHMIAEMRRVRETYGINSFELVHDMFTVDRKRVIAFCEALLASGEEFYWGCSARTDCIDEEMIALLSRAGCRGIFFGIESGSARMQKIIDKGLELNESAARVESCDKFKINTAVSLIAGFPDETMEDLRHTAAFFMDSLRYDHADPQLSILAPLADTPIHKQHRNQLLLNDDLADMSYRGWNQWPEDYSMIAEHPEIFSSFYSVPTPFVEREFLKEFRDFVLNGMRAFRWLLVALHQDRGSIVDVFEDWQRWHAENDLQFGGDLRTVYYGRRQFRADFLRFLRADYISNKSKAPLALATLVDCESALLDYNNETVAGLNGNGATHIAEEVLSPDSRPQLPSGMRLIKVSADCHQIIRRLRQKLPMTELPEKPVMLAICRKSTGAMEIHQLSPLSAELLGLCEGRRTVREIFEEFLLRNIDVPGVPPDMVCLAGIEMLRQQRLLTI